MAKTRNPGTIPRPVAADRSLERVLSFPLLPIRSEEELDRAIAVINSLIDREEFFPDEEDSLDVLGDIVEKSETEHLPRPPVPNAEMLRHLSPPAPPASATPAASRPPRPDQAL